MLTCVYHPIDPVRILEEEEASALKATGMWFDCPAKAQKYRDKVVEDMNKTPEEAKPSGSKTKKAKEKRDER